MDLPVRSCRSARFSMILLPGVSGISKDERECVILEIVVLLQSDFYTKSQ